MSVDLRAARTTYAYGVPDPLYRKGYHRGLDKGADAGDVIQWLSSGIVTQITRNNNIGTWVETTNELGVGGKFIGYGHTRAPEGLEVGDRVVAGADGPIVQGRGDDHGTDWGGPHVHIWTGNVSGDMGNAWGDDQDPTPLFSVRLASAGSSSRPIATTIYEEEDDMRVITQAKDDGTIGEVALISVEFPNGYMVAKPNTDDASGWLRMYSPRLDGTPHARLTREQYLGAIASARTARKGYLAGMAELKDRA